MRTRASRFDLPVFFATVGCSLNKLLMAVHRFFQVEFDARGDSGLLDSKQFGINLFVIDYLQLLHSTSRRAENRQQEIADISNGIKALAKELKVPMIVLSQLNRVLEKDKNRKPRLSDLRESGAIEQDANLVALLYKPTGGEDDDNDNSRVEQDAVPVNLLIAKQRNGPTGDVALTFLKAFTRFGSAAKGGAIDLPE